MWSSDEDWHPRRRGEKKWHKRHAGVHMDDSPLVFRSLVKEGKWGEPPVCDLTRGQVLYAFRSFCKHDNDEGTSVTLRLLKAIHERFQLTADEVRGINNYALHQAAKQDRLPVLQWLVATFQLTVDDLREAAAFPAAAGNGYLPMAQWLVSQFDLTIDDDVRVDNVLPLRCAAEDGNLEMVRFLCTHFPITVEDTAFEVEEEGGLESWTWHYCLVEKAIRDGHLDVAQYVCTAVGLQASMYGRVLQALVDTDNLCRVGDFLPVTPKGQ